MGGVTAWHSGWVVGRRGPGRSTTLPPVSCLYRSSGGWEDELEEGHEEKEEESANVPMTSWAPRLDGESKEAASSIAFPLMGVLFLPLPHPPTCHISKARTSPPRFLLSQGPGPFCLNPFLNLPLPPCS